MPPRKAPAKKAAPRKRPAAPRAPSSRRAAMPRARVIDVRAGAAVGWSGISGDLWTNVSASAIGPAEAIRVTSILGVVRWIAQAVAIMPVYLMRTLPNGRKVDAVLPCSYTIRKRPNPWQSSYDFYQLIAYWTALHGNAFARVIPGERGWCSELRPMHPTRVRIHRNADYTVWYEFFNNSGRWEELDQREVWHWRWLSDNGLVGMPPAELCETSVALARKLDAAATSFWDNSARPDMVLETDEKIPDEAVVALREALREVYGGANNRGKTAVLPKKTRLKPIESNSMEANQFQELRDAILPDVCRCWGVPSTLLGDAKMARWATVEQEGIFAQTWTLLPWMRRMEGPIDMAIQPVYGEDVYSRFDNRGILRGDTTSRVALYQAMFNMGALKPNELRDLEDFDLVDDPAADETYMQLGFSTLANAAASAVAAPAASEPPVDDEPAEGEPTPVTIEDDPLAAAAEGADLAATALNGAQVTALLEVLGQVSAGTLNASAAVALITSAFPTVSDELARQMVDGTNPAPQMDMPPAGGPADA